MSDELQKWLSSQECLSVLNECAKNAINRAERITLQIDDSYLDRKDYLSAVTGQLWCFVKDRAEEISRKATIPLASGDDDALTVLLTHEFLDFCLEKRRADSPFHSYFDVSEDEDGAPQTVGDKLITSVDSRDDDAWKRQLPILEMDIIDTQLEVLARDCTMALSGKQKILLVMKLEGEMTLAEMCSRVGEKNQTTLLYHIKKGIEVIREKWSLWGPPTRKQFTEVDEEEYLIFYRKVMEFCKNEEPCCGNKEGVYA